MCTVVDEFFGEPAQRALQRRADHVWSLLEDDPRFFCYGRAVGMADATDENIGTQIALARLQGSGSVMDVPRSKAGLRQETLLRAGLKTDQFVIWRGGSGSLTAAQDVIASAQLPSDLEVVSVNTETPGEDMVQLAELTQSCGVLLPMGAFMRGHRRPAVCLYVRDRAGRIVGSTAAVAQFHPNHPKADEAWWGMLATDKTRRGQGIALVLGALSMRAMQDRYGYERFFTGIREGNTASEKLCGKLGLAASDSVVMVAIDPELFAAGRITK